MPSSSRSYEFSVSVEVQVVEATAHKAYEICHLVGLKKASAIICVYTKKRRVKIAPELDLKLVVACEMATIGIFEQSIKMCSTNALRCFLCFNVLRQ